MAQRSEFAFVPEVAYALGVGSNTLKRWRDEKRGPRWKRLTRDPQSRPIYYREDVEKLQAALHVLERLNLRRFAGTDGPAPLAPPPALQSKEPSDV